MKIKQMNNNNQIKNGIFYKKKKDLMQVTILNRKKHDLSIN